MTTFKNKLKIALSAFALIGLGTFAIAQSGQGLWPSLPVVGGSAYCASSGNNGVCTSTVPAGPTALTGNEGIPANTNLSQGRSPQNVIITPASLGANPISVVTVTTPPSGISASNVDGGVFYTSTTTITSAAITLPSSAINGQTYRVSSNRTITTLNVSAASGDSMGTNTAPTVLTASLTVPQGYTFYCYKASTTCTWYRLQ